MVKRLRAEGKSHGKIAKATGLSETTVRRLLKGQASTEPAPKPGAEMGQRAPEPKPAPQPSVETAIERAVAQRPLPEPEPEEPEDEAPAEEVPRRTPWGLVVAAAGGVVGLLLLFLTGRRAQAPAWWGP